MKYTVKQLADITGVSKTTVRRHISNIPESRVQANSCKENNILYYSDELASEIIASLQNAGNANKERNAQAESELKAKVQSVPQRSATFQNMEQNVPESSATFRNSKGCNVPQRSATQTGENEQTSEQANKAIQTAIDALTAQLQSKDKQIEELTEMLKAAQLQIAVITERLNVKKEYKEISESGETTEEEQEQGEENNKPFLFFRLLNFKKKTPPKA